MRTDRSRVVIQPNGGGFQASVHVPSEWVGEPGVSGSQTPEGPWVGGDGATPEGALADLQSKLGRIWLSWWMRSSVVEEVVGS